jgi:histidinol-phosphate/aromatic aminotransferase/cobyric acid decarboxylase-like protein
LVVVPGLINCLLCRLPQEGPDAATIVRKSRERDLFLRDAGAMGTRLGSHLLRIAVKDAETNARMVEILTQVLANTTGAGVRRL